MQSLSKSSFVLIVDDDASTRISLKAVVESFGYRVLVAGSGQEALELFESNNCNIILSDWEMHGMTGPELCQRIRTLGHTTYTYFILLTSHSNTEHVVEGLEAGADDFMSKPFNPAELKVRIQSAERIESLDTMDITIFALAKMAESRDSETGQHLERVREYVKVLAEDIIRNNVFEGLDEEFVTLMYGTSPLHDIGKIAIPDTVLLKPGALNDAEFEIMKSHTIAGANTLKAALDLYPSHRFLQTAYDIARSHHERYDGSGYPDGLVGDEIPLSARLMAIADVYDALTSKRVYKDAMNHTVASSIIREGAGTHFDPRLVMVFDRVEQSFMRIRQELQNELRSAA